MAARSGERVENFKGANPKARLEIFRIKLRNARVEARRNQKRIPK